MSSIYDMARSGLQDASLRIEVSAHNTANAVTAGFVPRRVTSTAVPEGGVASKMAPRANPEFDARVDETALKLSGTNLVDEVAGSMVAVASFKANLASLQTAADLDKTLMSIKA